MAEKDNVYGGLGQIKNLYSDLYDRAAGATSAAGLGLFGLGSDIAGIIADNLNYDNFAKERMADAKNLRGRALDQLKGGFFGGDIRNPSKPVRMFGEDMTFADTFGERAEAKEQSVQEMLNELNQNAGLPDMGPVDTSKIKESNQSKAEAEASLQSEADQEQLFDNKLSADRASEKEASVTDLQKEVTDNQEVATQQGFSNAMEDYLQKAGKGKSATGTGGSGARSLEDYKKEFAKATGIDIKGGPDKSNFLMALGLGLMQNRAGKGFDVSKILTSVGKATETAMPKLEEAKKQYKAEQLAAGQYALKAQAKDRATAAAASKKLNQSKQYYVVPTDGKGGLTATDYVANIDNARLVSFTNGELNNLKGDADFNKNFAILPAENFYEVAKEAIQTPEGKDKYRETPTKVKLFKNAEAGSIFEVNVAMINPNNPDMRGKNPLLLQNSDEIYASFGRMYKDNQKMKDKFVDLGILTEDNRNVFTYSLDKINSLGAAFGIKFSEEETESDKIIRILENLAMKKAPDILGESGKTISDADRERVERIVGQLKAFGDIRTQRARIQDLFNDIVIGAESDIIEGITNLDRYANRNVAKTLFGTDSGSLIGKDAEDLIRLKNKFGIK